MGKRRERTEREIALQREPETLDRIVDFITEGKGSLGSWCQVHDVRFFNFYGWLHADKDRLTKYTRALEARQARLEGKVTDRLHQMVDADIRKAYRGNKLLPVRSLPDSVAAVVTEISDTRDGGKKLKLVPVDRAVELAGRHLGMFRERVEVEVTQGLSTRLAAARARAAAKK